MNCVTVLYPNKEGRRFDFGYYTATHIPMVARLLQASIEVRKGLSGTNGSPAAFVCLATIWIDSVEQFQTAMTRNGAQIMGDIPNYTNIEPIIQFDEVLVQAQCATR